MIHVIPHHIGKGSYAAWYDIIDFQSSTQEVTFHKFDTKNLIEDKNIIDEQPPNDGYFKLLQSHLEEIKPNINDWIVCDFQYLNYENFPDAEVTELAKKYQVKLVFIDDDNYQSYKDTEYFTYHSNKFYLLDETKVFNYYRYRISHNEFYKNLDNILTPYVENIREKKLNMFIGVDKPERFEVFKHTYNIGLDKDSYLAYSGFSSTYSDNDISSDLLKWKKQHIPKILDTPFEVSCHGGVNPDIPPLPYCMNSYVSCVLETQLLIDIDETEIHLSEKSWNPFASFNIPLLLCAYGTRKYLKRRGFWLADDLFDVSEKTTQRGIIEQFKSNLDIVNNMSNLELREYYMKHITHLDRNYNKLMNQSFTFNKLNYIQPKFKSNI